MTAIPDSLLKRIEDWCAEHPTGQIVLNVAAHTVKSYQFSEFGKVGIEAFTGAVGTWTDVHSKES